MRQEFERDGRMRIRGGGGANRSSIKREELIEGLVAAALVSLLCNAVCSNSKGKQRRRYSSLVDSTPATAARRRRRRESIRGTNTVVYSTCAPSDDGIAPLNRTCSILHSIVECKYFTTYSISDGREDKAE